MVDSGPADGPTYVLLHSLACTGLMTWCPVLDVVRQFGRVVVFDQRGHGQGISSPRFLLEDCADDVVAVADALGLRTFVPVGYSMGSMVAQLVWKRHRQRVDGLVLCAATTSVTCASYERLATGIFAALIEAFSPVPRPPRAVVVRGRAGPRGSPVGVRPVPQHQPRRDRPRDRRARQVRLQVMDR